MTQRYLENSILEYQIQLLGDQLGDLHRGIPQLVNLRLSNSLEGLPGREESDAHSCGLLTCGEREKERGWDACSVRLERKQRKPISV